MKKINLLVVPLTSVALLTSCKIKIEFGVFCDTNGVVISKPMASQGEDYKAEISLSKDVLGEDTDIELPEKLDSVKSGNRELIVDTEYTYKLREDDKTKADITISGKCIEGITNIYLDLVDYKIDNEFAFNEAIGFVGEEYLQMDGHLAVRKSYVNTDYMNMKVELSPTVSHVIHDEDITPYKETYVQREGEDPKYSYKGISRDKKDGKFEYLQDTAAKEWMDPEMLPEYFAIDAKYEQIKDNYDKTTHSYLYNYKYQEEIDCVLSLKFKNRKWIEFKRELEGTEYQIENAKFTYEENTPDIPWPESKF